MSMLSTSNICHLKFHTINDHITTNRSSERMVKPCRTINIKPNGPCYDIAHTPDMVLVSTP